MDNYYWALAFAWLSGFLLGIWSFVTGIYMVRRKEEAITKEESMTVNEFAVKIAKLEGKKKQVNIAQIKEILKIENKLLKGELYRLIRRKG